MPTITGAAGDDSLTGTAATDTVYGGDSHDTFIGSDTGDEIFGGARNHSFRASALDEFYQGGTYGGDGDITNKGSAAADYIKGNIGNDPISGGGSYDNLYGGTGSDTIYGGNTLIVGAGGDTPAGRCSIDTADYTKSTFGLTISRVTRTGSGGDAASDVLSGIENLTGSNNSWAGGAASLTGDGNANVLTGQVNNNETLTGNADNDALYGGAGADHLYGGNDDDVLSGGAGADGPWGGAGADTADRSTSPAGISVNPTAGAGSSGGAAGDTHGGIENVTGSAYADSLTGDGGANLLSGGAEDDTLACGVGADTLVGGDGTDLLEGREEGDQLFGDAGANFMSGDDGPDVFIVNVPADGFDDTIDGGSGADRLELEWAGPLRMIYAMGSETDGRVEFLNPDNSVKGTLTLRNIETVIPCFTPGTRIAESAGEVPDEQFEPRDLVVPLDSGLQAMRWIGRRDLTLTEVLAQPSLRPVRMDAGALGPSLPECDMVATSQPRLLVSGARAELSFGKEGVPASAVHLVGQPGILRDVARPVSYIHLLFERHEIVTSDGLWTERLHHGDGTERVCINGIRPDRQMPRNTTGDQFGTGQALVLQPSPEKVLRLALGVEFDTDSHEECHFPALFGY